MYKIATLTENGKRKLVERYFGSHYGAVHLYMQRHFINFLNSWSYRNFINISYFDQKHDETLMYVMTVMVYNVNYIARECQGKHVAY